MKSLCLLGLLVSAIAVAGSAIDVQQVSSHSFLLTYSSDTPVSVEAVQQRLFRPAVEVCAGREPVYGRYQQRNAFSVSSRRPGSRESYVFTQQIRCAGMR